MVYQNAPMFALPSFSRFNLLSSIVVNLLSSDNDTVIKQKSREALIMDNKSQNRVFLIHAR